MEDCYSFKYKLIRPFDANIKSVGQPVKIKELTLLEPSNLMLDEALKVDECLTLARKSEREEGEKAAFNASKNMSKEDIAALIEAASSSSEKRDDKADLANLIENHIAKKEFYNAFKELLVSGVCFIDKEQKEPLTEFLFSVMSMKDTKNLAVEYVSSFLLEG